MAGYKRVLLKLSGEALMGDDAFGINRATIERMVAEIKEVVETGVEMAVVIGGGNDFPWYGRWCGGYGSRNGRLHGYAGLRS